LLGMEISSCVTSMLAIFSGKRSDRGHKRHPPIVV
jgi:hypothetical protein